MSENNPNRIVTKEDQSVTGSMRVGSAICAGDQAPAAVDGIVTFTRPIIAIYNLGASAGDITISRKPLDQDNAPDGTREYFDVLCPVGETTVVVKFQKLAVADSTGYNDENLHYIYSA